MNRSIKKSIVFVQVFLIFSFTPFVNSSESKVEINDFYGQYLGGGRACTGELKLTRDSISWKSSWSDCKKTKYVLLKNEVSANKSMIFVRLARASKKCLYPIIGLTRLNSNNTNTIWEALGFQSLGEMESMETSKALACPVTKK